MTNHNLIDRQQAEMTKNNLESIKIVDRSLITGGIGLSWRSCHRMLTENLFLKKCVYEKKKNLVCSQCIKNNHLNVCHDLREHEFPWDKLGNSNYSEYEPKNRCMLLYAEYIFGKILDSHITLYNEASNQQYEKLQNCFQSSFQTRFCHTQTLCVSKSSIYLLYVAFHTEYRLFFSLFTGVKWW